MNALEITTLVEAHIGRLSSEGLAYAAQAVRLALEAFLAQEEVRGADGERIVASTHGAKIDASWRAPAGNTAFVGPMIGEEALALGRLLAEQEGAAWVVEGVLSREGATDTIKALLNVGGAWALKYASSN